MRFPKIKTLTRKPSADEAQDLPNEEAALPDQDDAMAEDATTPHKSALPRNLHWIVIVFVAVGLGAATFVTGSAKEAAKQGQTEQQENAPGMSADEARKRGNTAEEQIKSEQTKQEMAAEKAIAALEASQAMAAAPSTGSTPAINGTGTSNTANKDAPSQALPARSTLNDANGQPLPPAPPAPTPIAGNGTQYSPTSISELGAAQGGSDAVRQRSSALIVLQGSGQGSTAANAGAAAEKLAAETASTMNGLTGRIVEAASNNKAQIFAPQLMGKSFPAQSSLEDVRAQLQAIRAQYGNGQNPALSGNGGLPGMPAMAQPQPLQIGSQSPSKAPQYIEAVKHDGRLVIRQGKYIPAAFLTGINSDLAGDITAIVTENIYDSIGGMTLLIPKGSTLIASYGSDIVVGQERVMISFNRIELPNGDTIQLGSMNGIDPIGQSGTDAEVNNHFLKQFGAGLIGAVVAWGADNAGSTSVTINNTSTSTSDLTTSTGKVIKDITDRILDRYKNIKPTLTVAPGEKIRLYVGKDIALSAYQN